jgi:hypothetical protein
MKVDLVADETYGTILRFFEFSADQLADLVAVLTGLAQSPVGTSFQLAPSDSITALNVQSVAVRVAAADRGASVRGTTLEWTLTSEGWLEVAERAGNIDAGAANKYQWLDQSGRVSVLLSPSGQW